ncbi:hypothetical protein JCM11251_000690 [Rhodosporidiobolus azoricus]
MASEAPRSDASTSGSISRRPSRRPALRNSSIVSQAYDGGSREGSPVLDSSAQLSAAAAQERDETEATSTPPRIRGASSRRSLGNPTSATPPQSQPQAGTFLTRFLGSFKSGNGGPARPPLPRSLSSPIHLQTDVPPQPESEPSPSTPAGSAFLPVPGGFPPASPAASNSSQTSLTKRLKPSFRRSRSQAGSPQPSPTGSPAASPGLAGDVPALSPGSPATLRGLERDPMERLGEGLEGTEGQDRRQGFARRGSVLSQMTVQAHDHAYPMGSPLQPISEPALPPPRPAPALDSSLELIATLLPPALLLLSQLGPTHLFSPPLQLPSLFEATLAAAAARKSSVSSASGSAALLSSSASIASTATASTTGSASTSMFHLPTTDHLIPSHTHELHAPSTLAVPAVSAGAIWRLFRGFEWIGEVGKGEQPLPPSPVPPHLGGQGAGPPLEAEDEPEQVFDFPAMLQGVADVLAADAAARGVELLIGQVGSGSAPSPAATPGLMADKAKGPLRSGEEKDAESRELLVRADERAWSVTLIWVLHHILAGARSGSTIDVRFVATAADPPIPTSPSSASIDDEEYDSITSPYGRKQKWWNVSVDIVHTAAIPPILSPPFPDEATSPPPPAPLPSPPFDTAFSHSLFSLVQLSLVPSPTTASDTTAKSWVLKALLPAARPRTQSIAEDPSSLLGRRRASLEVSVGQEPSMNDLKRFAETALKGHKVALHAGETSTFAKHLTTYLAGWGMDVQHVPIEREHLSNGSVAGIGVGPEKGGRPPVSSRFDSGFETAGPSPTGSDSHGKSPDLSSSSATSSNGDSASSLVIIDDDVSTLRRLLVSLRAPPLHFAPALMAKRPQLAARRTRSSPHVRQLHQLPGHSQSASQWVIVHFASLTHYKSIKEIVQDTLATSRSPNLPEVLVVPKPAGPRRIITAIWTALKRPAVDPSLPPIATSPTSPGIQYWTPRLSPALAKEHDFDFSSDSSGKAGDAPGPPGATLGKPRTPPTYYNASGQPLSTGLPPSPLGRMSETQDSYFSTVTEELKEATPSEGMIIQSPDGRSGIFFQPQPKSTRSFSSLAKEKGTPKSTEREKDRTSSLVDDIPEEAAEDDSPPLATALNGPSEPSNESFSAPPSHPPSRLSTYTPLEMGLGGSRRIASGSSSHSSSGVVPTVAATIPPSTPALTLDSFINAAASGRPLADNLQEGEEGPRGETLSRQLSNSSSTRANPPSSRRSISNSSGSAHSGGTPSSVTSPRSINGVSTPFFSPVRRNTSSTVPSPTVSPPPATPGPAAQAGAAAAKAMAASSATPTSPTAGRTSRRGTVTALPKNKRKSSRRGTLPAVPPISVLIVEDNPINQTILSVFMRKKGISFKVAKDGEQAVQMWKKGNFHLVLMDIQLPVKDGIEATREIREMERQNNIGTFITTPTSDLNSPMSTVASNPMSAPSSPLLNMPVIIVALTASSLQADRVSALAAGCNDFLTKPVSLPWLESKLVEWGSMAYLSGFKRNSDSSDSSVLSTSRAVTPARPLSPTSKPPPGFKEGLANQADKISQHLHIDRLPGSRSSSPSLMPREPDATLSPITSPESSPPNGADVARVAIAEIGSHAANPLVTFTGPTPHDTPAPKVPAVPGAMDTPAPAAGGNAQETLDGVDEKLEGLVLEQKEREEGHELPQRPGPSPLAPSVLTAGDPTLDDVMAEGNRLINASRGRANSASFSQAINESGLSSGSTRNSAESIVKKPDLETAEE